MLSAFMVPDESWSQRPSDPTAIDQPDQEFLDVFQEGQRPLVLAHYMPWYTAKPVSGNWGWHWTMNHFDPDIENEGRREIASKYYPLIGPYDSGDPAVIRCHLLLMKLSGIDGVIVDWYGLTEYRDYPILHRNTTRLLQQCERLKMKFVICYEDQTISALRSAKRLAIEAALPHAVKEINWLGKYWFKSPSYVRFNDRPVLLSFGHEGLSPEQWSQCLTQLDQPILYYSQDYRRDGAVGSFGWPSPNAGMAQVDRFLEQAQEWPSVVPAAFPRFDDIYAVAGVGDGYPKLPDAGGDTLAETLAKTVRKNTHFLQIATWNDWGEGTQVEPSVEFGYRDLETIQGFVNKLVPEVKTDPGSESATPRDLRLPIKLLALRRRMEGGEVKGVDVDDLIDQIEELIVRGKQKEAWQKFRGLERLE
ncbi:glycoside hydrolase family 71/99-like protein [bacterium]|nr:glycoside hydrolase family 71/99-like protein [bacterium]